MEEHLFPDGERPQGNIYRRVLNFLAFNRSAEPMSPIERETLNPCEKLQRYGKIPWKLCVHTALVAATSCMVYMWSSNDALHIRHSNAHFHRALLGVSGNVPAERVVEISFSEDLKTQLDATVQGYWRIDDSKLTDYTLCKGPLIFTVFYKTNNSVDSKQVELYEDSWKDNAAYQFLSTNITSNIQQYSITGVVHDKFQGTHWDQCLRWSLNTVFEYGGTGLVLGSLDTQISECSKSGSTNWAVPITVLFLAMLSLILGMRSRKRSGAWFWTNIGSNGVQILAALACLRLHYRMDVSVRFALIGLAAGTAWISILSYLRYFHVYYVLVRTLSRAVPQCARFVVGVCPILLGYALLGNCLFFESQMFATIPGSIATLFSLLNGDIIRDTFTDVSDLLPFWGEMYLYTFLCLFIYVVLHIFISIVEEAYFGARIPLDEPMHAEMTPNIDDSLILGSIENQILFLRQTGRFETLRFELDRIMK